MRAIFHTLINFLLFCVRIFIYFVLTVIFLEVLYGFIYYFTVVCHPGR